MTVDAWLVIADALHGHAADNVVLLVPGGEVWPDPATVLIGILYGPTGTEYLGELSCESASDIAAAVRAELSDELLRLIELHKIHGLEAGSPLTVSPTQRSAGGIVQTLSEAGGTTTVTRQ
jgi:hypothetical protein